MVPRCLATTTPREPAALPAAGQSAANAATTAVTTINPLSFTIEPLPCVYRPRGVSVSGTREGLRGENLRSGELAAQPDEQCLEGQRHGELELLRLAPCGPDDLARPLGALQALACCVGPELVDAVDVDDRGLGAGREDDEVAVPPLELLERGEQLVPLRAALRAAHALLRLAPGQLEHGDCLLGALLRLGAALRDALEQGLG